MSASIDAPQVQSQILEAFEFRHATKVFDPARKIPDAQFETILQAIRLSPSSFGAEPWQLLIVQDPAKREVLKPFTWGANGATNGTAGQLGTASHFGIFLAHTGATMKAGSDYLARHIREVKGFSENIAQGFEGILAKFQEHDFKLETDRQITDWSARQAYIALGNAMTVAAMLGIDSCPIEGFEIDKTEAALREHFDVDTSVYKPAVMVAFGYRAGPPMFPKTRRTMDQIVRWV